MNNRKTATLVGIFYIIGTVAGSLNVAATGSILESGNLLAGIAANETRWLVGTLLILVMGFPLAMIPALTYPIFKKHNEVLAMGTIIFRGVLEAMAYIASTLTMLMLFSASRAFTGAPAAEASGLMRTSELLLGMSDWVSIILAIVFSIGALLFNYLLFQTRLVPRWLSGWGFIGAFLYFVAPLISMLEAHHYALSLDSRLFILLAPTAIQEMVFAVWVIAKGFQPTPQTGKLPAGQPA
ncbi:MAG: hypothetical protein PWQ55_550 [Chloroflexota bacterium]|nr:hypothetical protein [Chloroflexota bacterium]